VIQNVADPQRNGRIEKVFELAEPRFLAQYRMRFPRLSDFSRSRPKPHFESLKETVYIQLSL